MYELKVTASKVMGTCTAEVPDIGFDLPMQMTITQEQDMIQQFTPDAADETLAYGVGFRCFDWRMDHIDAAACGHVLELRTKLTIIIADEETRSFAKRRGFA